MTISTTTKHVGVVIPHFKALEALQITIAHLQKQRGVQKKEASLIALLNFVQQLMRPDHKKIINLVFVRKKS